jgi:hypothetical protein
MADMVPKADLNAAPGKVARLEELPLDETLQNVVSGMQHQLESLQTTTSPAIVAMEERVSDLVKASSLSSLQEQH